ncbi:NAD(P)-binding protein [Mycena olivaceomarginata]|nr:NAD(P)-binding protein [Mycena olivaceomarginata]
MTITKAQSTPLIAVVGATGVQGGSVIKALSESDKPYRIRGFTRDVAKPAAEALKKRGVELVAVNLVLENKEEVYKAFVGADYAFLVTNYWEHMNSEREVSEGKLLIDAAKAAGVKGIIWSGLVPVKKISGGKYTKVEHFDGKAQVTEYGRTSGVPFVDVQAGMYASNLLGNFPLLVKEPDGTFALPWAVRPTAVMPTIDMENDYGLYVRWVLEMPVFPDGLDVYTTSEDISLEDQARQISEGTGKKVVFKQISPEAATQRFVSLGFPPAAAVDIVEGFQFFDEFGYYGGNPSTGAKGLARPTRTFAEFVKNADWSKVLA